MADYTREDLITLCERAIVPEKWWMNRDTASMHINIGEAWALLKAGCDFTVITQENAEVLKGGSCVTDDDTIWLYIYATGFKWFEDIWAENDEERASSKDQYLHYIPTAKRLDEVDGGDWY